MEHLYAIALQCLKRLTPLERKTLLDKAGSATAVFENRGDIRAVVPDATPRLQEIIDGMEACLPRAEQELQFAEKGLIKCITLSDKDYPQRLRQCPDAPVVLFLRGDANLNSRYIISVVGTRQITDYGKQLCADFIAELSSALPGCLVVSGLAYGVDIHAHRAALSRHLPTVGVLAHGLDQIYPTRHRQDAINMLNNGGGVLTEYLSGTIIDKLNFVQRNRIVAGMADATIVVESASKGGSLITAELANDYSREVFAFPGRIDAPFSAGCNRLIQKQEAHMLLSVSDFLNVMGWENAQLLQQKLQSGIQQELFPELTSEQQVIYDALKGSDGLHINDLASRTSLPIHRLSSLLFSMEFKGIIRKSGSNLYSL